MSYSPKGLVDSGLVMFRSAFGDASFTLALAFAASKWTVAMMVLIESTRSHKLGNQLPRIGFSILDEDRLTECQYSEAHN